MRSVRAAVARVRERTSALIGTASAAHKAKRKSRAVVLRSVRRCFETSMGRLSRTLSSSGTHAGQPMRRRMLQNAEIIPEDGRVDNRRAGDYIGSRIRRIIPRDDPEASQIVQLPYVLT